MVWEGWSREAPPYPDCCWKNCQGRPASVERSWPDTTDGASSASAGWPAGPSETAAVPHRTEFGSGTVIPENPGHRARGSHGWSTHPAAPPSTRDAISLHPHEQPDCPVNSQAGEPRTASGGRTGSNVRAAMCDPPCGRFPIRNTRIIGADARYGLVTAERLLSPDPPLVPDVECDSRSIPSFVHPGRNGYLWLLVERRADGIDFVDAELFVHQNVFTTIDPRTGRPSYDPSVFRVPAGARSSARPTRVARPGSRRPSIRSPGFSTFRPTRTSACR